MTKRMLCIVSLYHPEVSANTVCADNLMKNFQQRGYIVDFLAFRQNIESKNITDYEYGTIIKFDTYRSRFLNKFHKIVKAKSWNKLNTIIRKTLSGLVYVREKLVGNKYPKELDKKTLKHIKELCYKHNEKYDFIVSISAPITMHVIAMELLKIYPTAKWYPVFLDPYVYNSILKNTHRERRLVKNRKSKINGYMQNADKIFMQYGIMQENLRRNYTPDYHKKVIEISLPNLIDNTFDNIPHESNYIELAYGGVFYKDIRNPKEMFRVLDKLGDGYRLTLMSSRCDDVIKKFEKSKEHLVVNKLGFLERNKSLEIIKHSNILVNLSNTVVNQMPSKVFDYIGMGKPVINLYFDENDTSLQYFKKYPLAFNLNLNKYDDTDIAKLRLFCKKNKNKHISYDEATKNLQYAKAQEVNDKFFNDIVQ